MEKVLRISGSKPSSFEGTVVLPPSKSYLHRALFVSSLCKSPSQIENCGLVFSEDVTATITALESFGIKIERRISRNDSKNRGSLIVHPNAITSSQKVFACGSGTTARFAIAFAAIATDDKTSTISGDSFLLKRPMQPLLDSLGQIGVVCYSTKSNGRLPVVVKSEGIEGGKCVIDGSISSQFISALLIASTQARNNTTIEISDFAKAVSFPYVEATISVLRYFGFRIETRKSGSSLTFQVERKQTNQKGQVFLVPGDMSSAAALIGSALASSGSIKLKGIDSKLPQADSSFLKIARNFGANVSQREESLLISAKRAISDGDKSSLVFDLKQSPDLVPIVAGTAAALGRNTVIKNVAHLRFKESDRLGVLSSELGKLGLTVAETKDSLSISKSRASGQNKIRGTPILLSSHDDHRILMSLTIAGISGKYGELLISNPDCVRKSYPSFISDLKSLMKNERILSIVKRSD